MPFVAETVTGEIVTPEEASRPARYSCTTCGSDLSIRESHSRDGSFVARHFAHRNGTDCTGGESYEHRKMKSIAFSKAKRKWPSADVRLERSVQINSSYSESRIADVLVDFGEYESPFCLGIAIECQLKHDSKEKKTVEIEYVTAGISTLWLYPEHFDGFDVDLGAGEWYLIGDPSADNKQEGLA